MSSKTPNMDQILASLARVPDDTGASRRIIAVSQASGELFDAASRILEWLQTIRIEDRPIALFNRLDDAINGVREAHQMEPKDVVR